MFGARQKLQTGTSGGEYHAEHNTTGAETETSPQTVLANHSSRHRQPRCARPASTKAHQIIIESKIVWPSTMVDRGTCLRPTMRYARPPTTSKLSHLQTGADECWFLRLSLHCVTCGDTMRLWHQSLIWAIERGSSVRADIPVAAAQACAHVHVHAGRLVCHRLSLRRRLGWLVDSLATTDDGSHRHGGTASESVSTASRVAFGMTRYGGNVWPPVDTQAGLVVRWRVQISDEWTGGSPMCIAKTSS